ncbi:hypothetical protein [Kitasatospora camelliae]|uniref:Outer membrane channel protein CpnT-like N-terminal domain-containing protein n=1 Tax=Kitasatospora camelliae TaxID=3156397 RepID=A0AAU8JMN0_9ACTN
MIHLPPDLAEVLKVIQSNEDGKGITFPDSNEDLLGDLAYAWEKWNTFAETRIGAIVANAKLAMEAMEGEAAESFAAYLRKFSEGDGSHVSTTVSAASAIAQSLRGAIEAVTQTKNEMIRELEYTKEYIKDNPAGKNDDIAKSEGIKEAVATYNTYVDQVGGNVDSMLRQGSGHFQQMTAAAEVASLTGGSGGGGGGGDTGAPPRTTLDGVSGVTAPNTLQTGINSVPGAGVPAPVGIQGFQPGGAVPGSLPGGGVPGMPGVPLSGQGGRGGGAGGAAPALQPFKMPTPQAPTPFGGGGGGLGSGGGGGFGGGGSSLGPDGKPAFKLPPVGTPAGLTLAGHQPPGTDGQLAAPVRSTMPLRPFTPGGADPGGTGGLGSLPLGGLPLGGRGGTGSTPGSLIGRPGGLPGGTLPGRGTTAPFTPGGRAPGAIAGAGGLGGSGRTGAGSGLGGGARVGGSGGGGLGGGASAVGGYHPGGGRTAGGLGRAEGGAHPLGTPTTAGGVGAGGGRGAGGGAGASGSAAASARGMAGGGTPGMPGMHGMGGGAAAGAAKSGSRFVRPTRFGMEEDEEETVALRDAGILGQAVHHTPQDRHWQRMRQRWIEESGMAPAPEPAHTAVAAAGQEAPAAGGGDLMSQLAAAVLGPEGASSLNTTSESGGSGSAGDTTATAASTASGSGSGSGSPEEEYLERARSVAERRGRPDEEPATTGAASAAAAPAAAAPADGPPPLREEGGYQVPTPFMRAALARLASSGGFAEGSGEAPAGAAGGGAAGAAAGQGR